MHSSCKKSASVQENSSIPFAIQELNATISCIDRLMRKAGAGARTCQVVKKAVRFFALEGRRGSGWVAAPSARWEAWGGISRMQAYRIRQQLIGAGAIKMKDRQTGRGLVKEYRLDVARLICWLRDLVGYRSLTKAALKRLDALKQWSKGRSWPRPKAPENPDLSRNLSRNIDSQPLYKERAGTRAQQYFLADPPRPETVAQAESAPITLDDMDAAFGWST
ncbi:hypothetical protein JANAI62_03850 [Jannaschia pagri]|uniref:Helix-turn-helix domain-containing protein n=2 Tax=Roseobacteraceae TaxID=2854170 RepID=A0ABQ4NI55_9RHOB|nr:hypothetical protein JANAI61_05900 [Jannaschia sp. AI_61]GIT93762.1 hypothetical protein JANAI62_03850 [Jannaschia sp. AI_62]